MVVFVGNSRIKFIQDYRHTSQRYFSQASAVIRAYVQEIFDFSALCINSALIDPDLQEMMKISQNRL